MVAGLLGEVVWTANIQAQSCGMPSMAQCVLCWLANFANFGPNQTTPLNVITAAATFFTPTLSANRLFDMYLMWFYSTFLWYWTIDTSDKLDVQKISKCILYLSFTFYQFQLALDNVWRRQDSTAQLTSSQGGFISTQSSLQTSHVSGA